MYIPVPLHGDCRGRLPHGRSCGNQDIAADSGALLLDPEFDRHDRIERVQRTVIRLIGVDQGGDRVEPGGIRVPALAPQPSTPGALATRDCVARAPLRRIRDRDVAVWRYFECFFL
jgi:hypothetical protein